MCKGCFMCCWLVGLLVVFVICSINTNKKSNKKIQPTNKPTNKTYELIYLRENCKKWTFMPFLVSMSIFYITIIHNHSTFAPEKLETGTALRATNPIFRARSATLFCTELQKEKRLCLRK